MFPETMTLKDARAQLRGLADHGAFCPLCQQNVKVYKRTIHASMARGLIRFYRHVGSDWGFLPDVLDGIGENADFGKLRYWGLVEHDEGQREDGSNRNGWPTPCERSRRGWWA